MVTLLRCTARGTDPRLILRSVTRLPVTLVNPGSPTSTTSTVVAGTPSEDGANTANTARSPPADEQPASAVSASNDQTSQASLMRVTNVLRSRRKPGPVDAGPVQHVRAP